MMNDATSGSETPEVDYERLTEVANRFDWFRVALAIIIVGLLIWWRLA